MANFEGWFKPKEKPELTAELKGLEALPKGILRGARFEAYIGNTQNISTDPESGRVMTSPVALRRFILETAARNGVSKWEVAQAIREYGVNDPDQLAEIVRRYKETIAYVSDIHGGNAEWFERLEALAAEKPDVAIFEGDILGTEDFARLQYLFYNRLQNYTRNELLKNNPNVSDDELLSYTGKKPPEAGFTVKNGFHQLRRFELNLEGKSEAEIDTIMQDMTEAEIANEVRRYSRYVHYGHYASNLPKAAKKKLAEDVEQNAKRIADVMKKMQANGTEVAVIEGNWDVRIPVDFVSGVPEVVPLPPNQRLFLASDFFRKQGIEYINELTVLYTKTSIQILLPFDAITGFKNIPTDRMELFLSCVRDARKEGKAIIMVAHGEPNWQIHNMIQKDPVPSGEHALVVAGLTEAVRLFQPDEIIYGHVHDPMTDELGEKQDKNVKYALRVQDDGSVELAPDPGAFGDIVASHMQLHAMGTTQVPKRGNRGVTGFGGDRGPLKLD